MSAPIVISVLSLVMGLIMMILSAVGLSKEKDKNSDGATYHKANLGLSFIPMIAGGIGIAMFKDTQQYCRDILQK